ncbi:hypothetical protein C7H79_12010 [Nitrosomonas supralitoralis]|uniref:Uncharacterized protein n=1 Tax=Nitrosomonas supralitoralis TaxID=2116706 RepID=A0A2P7NTI0_9PROT|nr:hypothetical protein C7H79_12010 [Nitrosomonas supralitoralis]
MGSLLVCIHRTTRYQALPESANKLDLQQQPERLDIYDKPPPLHLLARKIGMICSFLPLLPLYDNHTLTASGASCTGRISAATATNSTFAAAIS